MATDIEMLQTLRSHALAQLVSIRENPKPTYWINDQRVHWEEYAESLQRSVDWCEQKLADTQPFQVCSEGRSS